MKAKNWLLVMLIGAFLAVFYGYRAYDAIRTDTVRPEITISGGDILEVSVEDDRDALLQGITVYDDRDGDVTDTLVVETMQLLNLDGTVEVNFAAMDRSGNVAKASRRIRYTDYESPRFSLHAPLIYTENYSFDVMGDIGATDRMDGDLQHRIRATLLTESSISARGTHQVHFQVTNSLGDTAELVMPVEVLEAGTYEASLSLTDYLIYLPQGSEFRPREYLDTFTLRGESTSLRTEIPRNFRWVVDGKVDPQVPGVYTLTYKVNYKVKHETNPAYDQTFTGYSRLIVVVEG